MTLPSKNQIVTVRLHETSDSPKRLFTGLVATVSKAHEEFSIVIGGKLWWFGAGEVCG